MWLLGTEGLYMSTEESCLFLVMAQQAASQIVFIFQQY